MCEQCRQRVGDEMYDAIREFVDQHPDTDYGPGHIVLADFNCEPGHIRWCAGLAKAALARRQVEPETDPGTHYDVEAGIADAAPGGALHDIMAYDGQSTEALQATLTFLVSRLLPMSVATARKPH